MYTEYLKIPLKTMHLDWKWVLQAASPHPRPVALLLVATPGKAMVSFGRPSLLSWFNSPTQYFS